MTKHNVETINHALRGAAEAEMVHTQSLVTEHYLPMWEVLNEETKGAWPEKSLTKKMIANSERLTDLFVFLLFFVVL